MLRVGLTGGIGSGKSTVANRLADLGAFTIDADELARAAVAKGSSGLAKIVATFSERILDENGDLDRSQLGRIVFGNEAARRKLEGIVHPQVRRLAFELESQAPSDSVVVHVIPLLVETNQDDCFDVIVVVDADPQLQEDRVRARDGIDSQSARERIAAQATREQRLAAADFVIRNEGSLANLIKKTDKLYTQLQKLS